MRLGCIILLILAERGGGRIVVALRLGLGLMVVVLLPWGEEGGLGAGEAGAEGEVEVGEVGCYAGDNIGGGGAGEERGGYTGVEGREARVY